MPLNADEFFRMKSEEKLIPRSGTLALVLVLVLGILISAVGSYLEYRQIDRHSRAEFERLAERTELEVERRLNNVVRGLYGIRALYAASDHSVTHDQFRRAVMSRDIDVEFPGVRGFGFVQRVERSDLPKFVATAKADGASDFEIKELADKNKQDLFVVRYIEPLSRNRVVLGLDLGSEALRRAGLQQAINTGAATVTGSILLDRDSRKIPGFLLFVPVYRPGASIEVPRERREALIGVLYAPIAPSEVLQGMPDVQSGMIELRIVDSPINSPDGTEMFDATGQMTLQASTARALPTGKYFLRKPLQLPGRIVTMAMQTTPAFDASVNSSFPWILFVAGMLITGLLANVVHQQSRGRQLAEALAREMTKDLQAEIEERKVLEVNLAQARDEALESSRLKSAFLANMSHELRTPMNAILGMLNLLQRTELSPRQIEYAIKTEGAAKSLLGLLNDVLDFSKVEAGKMTLEIEPLRLESLLRSLSIVLSANVGAKDIELLFDLDTSLPTVVKGDAMRLQQVLTNLGGNAIKFTPEGSVVLALRKLSQSNDAVEIEFSIQDTGIGISAENQSRIFSGFSQAEASITRRFGGTGLGLAISQRFVQMMGGEIQVKSKLGEGSTFSFVLKLEYEPETPQGLAEPGLQRLPPRRVLVVDDSVIAGPLMIRMVQSWGWSADLAISGKQALEMVTKGGEGRPKVLHYPVIYMDWQLPDMDGWEVTRKIRQFVSANKLVQPTVVMVTAHGREVLAHKNDDEQKLLDGFLVKPVTALMLYESLIDASSGKSGIRKGGSSRGITAQLQGMRILVVEDNLINQQVAQELLAGAGAIVSLAENGQAGVESVAHASPPFDVVLMDLQMPILDGYGATKAIREGLGLTQLPIIAMTANAMASDREACIAAGMNDHIGKPFDMANLVSLLIRTTGLIPTGDCNTLEVHRDDGPKVLVADGQWIDSQAALNRMAGSKPLYVRAAKDFQKILGTLYADLLVECERGDPGKLTMSLHTLKGNAATLGANSLSDEARRLEQLSKTEVGIEEFKKELLKLEELIEQTRCELDVTVSEIQKEIESNEQADPPDLIPTSDDLLLPLTQLVALLEHSDMQALHTFAEVRANLARLPQETFEQLERSLQELDFQSGLEICRQVLGQIKPTPESNA